MLFPVGYSWQHRENGLIETWTQVFRGDFFGVRLCWTFGCAGLGGSAPVGCCLQRGAVMSLCPQPHPHVPSLSQTPCQGPRDKTELLALEQSRRCPFHRAVSGLMDEQLEKEGAERSSLGKEDN